MSLKSPDLSTQRGWKELSVHPYNTLRNTLHTLSEHSNDCTLTYSILLLY
jgi:hypothetical protein